MGICQFLYHIQMNFEFEHISILYVQLAPPSCHLICELENQAVLTSIINPPVRI